MIRRPRFRGAGRARPMKMTLARIARQRINDATPRNLRLMNSLSEETRRSQSDYRAAQPANVEAELTAGR